MRMVQTHIDLFIFSALDRNRVRKHWISLLKAYYSGIYSKSSSLSAPSSWNQHFRGIFAGFTLPTFLPLVRAFMDDMSLMLSFVAEPKDLLSCCTSALTWAGMSYRVDKFHSIVIIKGRSINSTPFRLDRLHLQTFSTIYHASIPNLSWKKSCFQVWNYR